MSMTPDEHRALDVRVAVEIMGYVWWSGIVDRTCGVLLSPYEDQHHAVQWESYGCHRLTEAPSADKQECEDVPRYSTRIEDAWQIVESGLIRNFMLYRRKDGTYSVQAGDRFALKARGATAPEAICRAALAAVGKEGQGE